MAESLPKGFIAPNVLRCACDPFKTMRRISLSEAKAFQGNLKTLSATEYEKLKQTHLKYGCFCPLFLWHEHAFLLDGHQRTRLYEREGWTVDGGIPVVDIEAETEQEAAEKLLIIVSTYGKVDPQGVYEFTEQYDLSLVEFTMPDLPDFDETAYKAGYYGDFSQDTSESPDEFPTYDETIEIEYCCPKCGYEWSGKPK